MIAAPTTGALAVVLNTVLQVFNAGSSFLYTNNSPIGGGGGETPTTPAPRSTYPLASQSRGTDRNHRDKPAHPGQPGHRLRLTLPSTRLRQRLYRVARQHRKWLKQPA